MVEISPNAVPPVCKLVDYGKFLYEQSKKAHEAKKHQKSSHIKEVKFRPSTAEHDYQVRKNQIIRFLGEGYKVKAMIFHRGREMAHQDVGRAKMDRLLKDITDHAQWNSGRGWKRIFCWRCWRRKKARALPLRRAVRLRPAGKLSFRASALDCQVFWIEPRIKAHRLDFLCHLKRKKIERGNCEEEQENEVEDAPRRRQALQDDATGKFMRRRSGKRHLLGTKKPRRMRQL